MTPRSRRLALDVLPGALAIGYGIVEPMMSVVAVPVGMVLLVWAGFRYRAANP
jgi:hypothetical protein